VPKHTEPKLPVDPLPRTRRSQEIRWHITRSDPGGGNGLFPETFQPTLAVLVVGRRSTLLACDFLYSVSDGLRGSRRKLIAEFFGSGGQTFDTILPVSLFVCLRALVHVRLAPAE
jgi:hypothetical protein